MTKPVLAEPSDEDLMATVVRLATEMSTCELTKRYDRLNTEVAEVCKVLRSRGPDSIKKLLPLLAHPISRVRYTAAVVCYDDAPENCNRILRELYAQKNPHTAIQALVFLFDRDPEFAKEFSEDMERRYGHNFHPPEFWKDHSGSDEG